MLAASSLLQRLKAEPPGIKEFRIQNCMENTLVGTPKDWIGDRCLFTLRSRYGVEMITIKLLPVELPHCLELQFKP